MATVSRVGGKTEGLSGNETMNCLTSFTERAELRDETNRLVRIYVERCSCGAPQPSAGNLHLDLHAPYCPFYDFMERELEKKGQLECPNIV